MKWTIYSILVFLIFQSVSNAEEFVVSGPNASEMILKRLKVNETLTPETSALFGDSIDLNTGAVSLEQTDVSIPGNSALPVSFSRKYNGALFSNYKNLHLGDWDISIPNISFAMIYDDITYQRYSGNWDSGYLCSGPYNPGMFGVGPTALVAPAEYWSGEQLSIPSVVSKKIQYGYYHSTNQKRFVDNWKFECITFNYNGRTMEGFRTTSPKGITYEFSHPKIFESGTLSALNGMKIDHLIYKYTLQLQVTSIKDRFGNFVNYNYSNGNLASIEANDGRKISVNYEINKYGKSRVSSITAAEKTWSYNYSDASHPLSIDILQGATLPDGKRWLYQDLESMNWYSGDAIKGTKRGEFKSEVQR